MKILYLHARDVRIQAVAGRSNNRRRLMQRLGSALPPLSEQPITSPDALLILVCVECGDGRLDLQTVRKDVRRARALLGVSEIVIGAFAHLSADAADALTARGIMDRLIEGVTADHAQTQTFPFGYDKLLEIKLPAHHYNAAFRSFEPYS